MPDSETKFDVDPDAAAEADVAAGRVFVPHAKVVEWLKSWGTPDELPRPKPERR